MWESAPDGHLALSNIIKTLHENIIKHHCYLHFMWELEGSSRWKVESPDRIKHYQISPTSSKYHQTLSDIIKYHYQTCKTGIGGAGAGQKTFERNFWNVSFLEGGEQGGKRSKIWWSSSSWSRIGSWQGVGKKPPRTSPYKDRGQAAPVKSSRAGQTHHLWMVNDHWSSLLYLPLSSSYLSLDCPVSCLSTTTITINLVTPSF